MNLPVGTDIGLRLSVEGLVLTEQVRNIDIISERPSNDLSTFDVFLECAALMESTIDETRVGIKLEVLGGLPTSLGTLILGRQSQL